MVGGQPILEEIKLREELNLKPGDKVIYEKPSLIRIPATVSNCLRGVPKTLG